jgi:hypothetical protein
MLKPDLMDGRMCELAEIAALILFHKDWVLKGRKKHKHWLCYFHLKCHHSEKSKKLMLKIIQCVSEKLTIFTQRWFVYRLEPISSHDRAAPKVVKSEPKIVILLLFTRLKLNHLYTLWIRHFLTTAFVIE